MTDDSTRAHEPPSESLYYSDADFVPSSPGLQPHRPKLEPIDTLPRVKLMYTQAQRTRADGVLLGELDAHRNPERSEDAALLLSDNESTLSNEETIPGSLATVANPVLSLRDSRGSRERGADEPPSVSKGGQEPEVMVLDPPDPATMVAIDLKSLARGALAVASEDPAPEPVNAVPTPPNTENDVVKERHIPPPLSHPIAIRQGEERRPDRPIQPAVSSPFTPRSLYSPREPGTAPLIPPMEMRSPHPGLPPASSLAPLQMHSPRSDTSGSTPAPTPLPSIRDLNLSTVSLPRSPPGIQRLPPMSHGSPPVSPAETFRGGPLSPHHPFAAGGPSPYYHHGNGFHRSPHDYPSSATLTPGSDHSASTGATSITEKMSIEGLTIQTASYVCNFQGCTAAPFQTQYLLNSHANVHSSARPHYCPVIGCPRSEGGKGFKRKNEMIRHGLVHDSPGYVCPFCPDREHKYPRPDNLQRHVRVHHMDKDKDDPLLRDVLAQRPDGPNKGRRRRAVG
ncbi:metallothionein expression activator [Echria macrotheca]|uniref:Metallothionein expression activator n=1 Tax=Echria macrotheca TaxID=438768 RepID=A0AAJ0B5J0_9PEZI|nr:metallothionein expression activator [Echria macrotheca]